MNTEKVVKSTQEQAVAAWIGLINQMRIDDLIENLNRQDQNLDSAMESMNWALGKIEDLVVANRGGNKGVHGFIAEVAECGLENAQSLVHGDKPAMEWVNDNGPADLLRDGVEIQVKFVNAGGKFSLDAVAARCADPAIADDLKYVLATANALAAGRYQVAYCPSLVRGQGYYTGMVFEITCPQFSGAGAYAKTGAKN